MKKFLAIVISIITVFGAMGLTACNKGSDYDGTLVLGFDAGFPPYGYEENGEYVGFDIEYARKVCESINYDLKLVPVDWDAKDAQLESGAIDCLWNGFTYEGREDGYEWSAKYLDNSIVVLTNKAEINTLSDLAGKIVAVQTDSSGEQALESKPELTSTFKNGEAVIVADYNSACSSLIAGAYDAMIIDAGVAKYLQANKSGLKILTEVISSETYAVGFKKGNVELANKISNAMKEVAKDTAFIQGLCEKYGVDYSAFLLK